MDKVGSASNPLRVAIVGSGPAGFYAAEELLKTEEPQVAVDMFDRLPTPYGLVRGGVAPDHQKIKSVIKLYARTAARPGFRFFGNVQFGKEISLEEMLGAYHQLLFTTGAEHDRRMGIPGEDLAGSFPATVFVGWYNGHPDYRHYTFDLSGEKVAVIGNGNVAMDVIRILAKTISELEKTDIADYALETLKTSNIREIYMLGRRGPAQAAFTNPEIRELTSIEGCDLVVNPADLELDEVNQEFLAGVKEPTFKRNVDILTAQIPKGLGSQPKKIHARFFTSPVEVLGTDRVEGLRLETNRLVKDEKGAFRAQGTGETEELAIQLLFRSIGYKGHPLAGLPFDEWSGLVPNAEGRVLDPESGRPIPRLYVAGWIKRGPNGVIGTNKPDAIGTVKLMREDLGALDAMEGFQPDGEAILRILAAKNLRYVTFPDWQRIDAIEVEKGKPAGRPRVKFAAVEDMLAALE